METKDITTEELEKLEKREAAVTQREKEVAGLESIKKKMEEDF